MGRYAVTICGVQFDSMLQFFKLLGYKHSMSDNFIKKQFGSIETLIKQRLNLTSDTEIKDALLKLVNSQKKQETKTQVLSDDVVTQCAKAYIKSVLNQDIDTQSLQVLMRAFNVQDQNAVIGEIERLKNAY